LYTTFLRSNNPSSNPAKNQNMDLRFCFASVSGTDEDELVDATDIIVSSLYRFDTDTLELLL